MVRREDRDVPLTVRVPADVDRPDQILAGLSAHQLALAGGCTVLLWLLYTATRTLLPLPVFAAVAAPFAGAGVVLVLGRKDGVAMDRLLVDAARQWRSPRRLVPAEECVPPPAWVAGNADRLPAPLRLPAHAISATGVIDLGPDGVAVVCACSTVNFSLRTVGEQNALVGGFARWLNSITGPIQLVIRADQIDLSATVTDLYDHAGALPHPALERAATEHAQFLTALAESRDLLRRQVLLVLREPVGLGAGKNGRDAAARRVLHWAEEANLALATAGVSVTALDGPAATGVLASACDPAGPPNPTGLSAPDAVIRGPEWS